MQVRATNKSILSSSVNWLTLFRMGFFRAAHGWGAKIRHTYSTMMKLGTVIPYLRKIQKIYKSRDTSLEFCWHQYFSPEINSFIYIRKYKYKLHFDALTSNFVNFFWVFEDCFNKDGCNFDMSAKLATPGLLEIKDYEIKVMT